MTGRVLTVPSPGSPRARAVTELAALSRQLLEAYASVAGGDLPASVHRALAERIDRLENLGTLPEH